jgi:hypothetical protein
LNRQKATTFLSTPVPHWAQRAAISAAGASAGVTVSTGFCPGFGGVALALAAKLPFGETV